MWEDPIVAEIRRVREEHAAKFNYDLDAIFRDIKDAERLSGCLFMSYPPRHPEPVLPIRAAPDSSHPLDSPVMD